MGGAGQVLTFNEKHKQKTCNKKDLYAQMTVEAVLVFLKTIGVNKYVFLMFQVVLEVLYRSGRLLGFFLSNTDSISPTCGQKSENANS